MANSRFQSNTTTRQILVDYAAGSLAPYTLLDCICSENSTNEGMSLIYETLNTAIADTQRDPLGGVGANQSLLVWDNTESEMGIPKFRLLSLKSSDGSSSDGAPASTIFGGDGNIYDRVKYADSLYNYNNGTPINNGLFIPYLSISNRSQSTIYLPVPTGEEAQGGNKAIIYSPDNGGTIKWGAAGAVLHEKRSNEEGAFCLIGARNPQSGASPSDLYYNQSVYFQNGNLYHASDETLKHFTSNLDINLDNLATIKKGYFYWNEDPDKNVNIGVTAQSVECLFPELVTSNMGFKAVDYSKLSVVALAAIDKLYERIQELEKQIEELKK